MNPMLLRTMVNEYKLVRRQARDLRKLHDFSTAYVFRRVAETWMKAARLVKKEA